MQPSFHIVKHLENTNLILFVVGNILSLIDQKGAVELTFKNEIVRERIRTVAFHSKRRILAISTNDKMLVLLDLKGNVINTRKLFKKATCLVFDETGTNILLGDKFGDCYRFSVDNDELKPILLLGHVSILTDLKLTGKFLISSDRDEKIRVNMYPNTYDIHRFCLGHSEFVSQLCVIPNSSNFVSGGGDSFLLLWNFETGQMKEKIEILDAALKFPLEHKPAVMKIDCHSDILVVLLSKCNQLLLFDITSEKSLKFKSLVELDSICLDFTFDQTGNIWATLQSELPVQKLLKEDGFKSSTNSILVSNLLKIKDSVSTAENNYFEVDLYRKWSQWVPDGVTRSQQNLSKDNAEPQSKKRKRGGVKQKIKAELRAKALNETNKQ